MLLLQTKVGYIQNSSNCLLQLSNFNTITAVIELKVLFETLFLTKLAKLERSTYSLPYIFVRILTNDHIKIFNSSVKKQFVSNNFETTHIENFQVQINGSNNMKIMRNCYQTEYIFSNLCL